MVIGIGIDAVEINRFSHWNTFTHVQLMRIFSSVEVTYCLTDILHSSERFAVRFAAKEAFFKAWNNAFPFYYAPLLTFCKAVSLERTEKQAPILSVKWHLLPPVKHIIHPLISLTHTQTIATVCVLLQSNSD